MRDQLDLIDTTPLGLWGDEPAQAVAVEPWTPRPPKPPAKTCLRCHKPAADMFCSKPCRARFIAEGEKFAAKMARSTLQGETASFLE